MLRYFLLAFLLMPAWLFAQTGNGKEKEVSEAGGPVNYELMQQGTYSGLRTPLTQVVSSKKDWEELWKKHVSMLVPQPPVPHMDFENYVVAVIALGEKTSSGYQIFLQSITAKGPDIVVRYKTTEPPQNSMTLAVLTQPYLFLKLPKPKGAVQFAKE